MVASAVALLGLASVAFPPHASASIAPADRAVGAIITSTPHNAFPAAARLTDGTILTVFRGAAHHRGNLSIGALYRTYSRDNGVNWTTPQKISLLTKDGTALSQRNHSDPGLMIPSYGPFKGKVILSYFENYPTHAEARVVVSKDAFGSAWQTPRNINVDPRWVSTLVSAPVTQIGPQSFIVAGYGRTGPNQPFSASSRIFMLSNQGNVIYGASARLAISGGPGTEQLHFTEPNIVSLGGGRLLALTRTNRWGETALHIRKSYSYDSGRTWTRNQFAFSGEGAPRVIRLADGTLLATGRHWPGPQSAHSPGNHWAVYRVSRDQGVTWSDENAFGENPANWMTYSSPVEYARGKVLLVTSLENSETQAQIKTYQRSAAVTAGGTRRHSIGTSIYAGRVR